MSGSSDAIPLIARADAAAPMLALRGQVFTQREWLAQVHAVAASLPAGAPLLNLCMGRHAFMAAFCGALLRGSTNVLASDPAPATVLRLRAREPRLRVLGDDAKRPDIDLLVDVRARQQAAGHSEPAPFAVPAIPGGLAAALPFTSGSTGEPQAHPKRFFAMRLTAEATEARLCAPWPRYSVLATVPSQHMYGLETTLMLALGGRARVACEHPLLPADIARLLAALPSPRVLVTTPVHLRALVRASAAPRADLVISATAPLSNELARRAEALLGCPVHEIYGCTEAGSLATRRTLDGDVWTLLDGYRIAPADALQGAATDTDLAHTAQVAGPQLAAPVRLPDRIECIDATRFRLLGRHEDVVNVGGKRASLAQLNQLLLQVDGVLDGLIHAPEDAGGESARLQGFVVTDGRDERAILRALAALVDPVFLPRPLRRVDAIPRNATGKVTRAALDALAADGAHKAHRAGKGDA